MTLRKYNVDLWCTKKHLLLVRTHLDETLEKLYRECREGKCSTVSSATRKELEDAVRNLIAAEEHLSEVIPNVDESVRDELRKLIDEIRNVRQDLTLTGIPFRVELPVREDAIKVIEEARRKVDEFITRLDKFAHMMEQEQKSEKCVGGVCVEDIGAVRKAIEEEIKRFGGKLRIQFFRENSR